MCDATDENTHCHRPERGEDPDGNPAQAVGFGFSISSISIISSTSRRSDSCATKPLFRVATKIRYMRSSMIFATRSGAP